MDLSPTPLALPGPIDQRHPDPDVIDAEFVDAPPSPSPGTPGEGRGEGSPPPLVPDVPSSTDPPARKLSAPQSRDVAQLGGVIHCDVRPQILLGLAGQGGLDGGAHVNGLAARTGLTANKISHHIGRMHDQGLLLCDRRGKEHWYSLNPDRIRYEAKDGETWLRIRGRDGEIDLILVVRSPQPAPQAVSQPAPQAVSQAVSPPPPPPPLPRDSQSPERFATDGARMNTDERPASPQPPPTERSPS